MSKKITKKQQEKYDKDEKLQSLIKRYFEMYKIEDIGKTAGLTRNIDKLEVEIRERKKQLDEE